MKNQPSPCAEVQLLLLQFIQDIVQTRIIAFSCQLSLCHHASSSQSCTVCGVSLQPCQTWYVLAEAAGSFAVSKGWLIPDLASQQTVLAPYGGFVQEDWLQLCVKVIISERRQVRAYCLL